jgi:hypothetical protein
MPLFKQTIITELPFEAELQQRLIWLCREWDAKWIGSPAEEPAPVVWVFRLKLHLEKAEKVRWHVTGDERYELLVDGVRMGRGPDRPEPNHWFFATFDAELEAGEHIFVARVWAFGPKAPFAQMGVRPGFLLAAEGPLALQLDTGRAEWEVKKMEGYSWLDQPEVIFDGMTGKKIKMEGESYPWGWETGQGTGWVRARVNAPAFVPNPSDLNPTRLLCPTMLPPQVSREIKGGLVRHVEKLGPGSSRTIPVKKANHQPEEARAWQEWLSQGIPLTLPPHSRSRVIVDLENYYAAYPYLVTTGGAGSQVAISWAEALFINATTHSKGQKDNRNEIEGRYFSGFANEFVISGGEHRTYDTLWWQTGRFLEIVVQTMDEPLTLTRLTLEETRYPLEMESRFSCDDPRWAKAEPIMVRGLQANAHEIFSDCPYYEQLCYVGDTALDVLVNYVISPDDRLARKVLRLYGASALPGGLTQSRYPSRVRQVIPPFSLIWVLMLCHHGWWKGDKELVRPLMPAARGVVEAFLRFRNARGLIQAPPGWNFMDWPKVWENGIPPDGTKGVSAVINWLLIMVLTRLQLLEAYLDEPEMAARAGRLADEQARLSLDAFWDESRGCLADDLDRRHFSEHTQSLALLSGKLPQEKREKVERSLLDRKGLTEATIYFSFYVMEAYRQMGRVDRLWERLELWFGLDALGFKTTPEEPEPSRSDCHAWGAHPLYHALTSVLGVRPASMGFETVEIRPQLGPLKNASGRMIHPRGWIESEWRREGDKLSGVITLPIGCRGRLILSDKILELKEGRQEVTG